MLRLLYHHGLSSLLRIGVVFSQIVGQRERKEGSVLHEAGYLAYCVCSLAMTDEPQYDVRLFFELRRLTPEPIETALTQKNGCLIQL